MSDPIAGEPARFFPLVRHLSARLTPVLARLPVTANQITLASLLFGLGASGCVALASWPAAFIGGVFLVAGYVLDNCDGEIARLKGQSSEFGRRFDNFVDWAVHTAFFAALGWGSAMAAGEKVWLWLGAIAAAGSTINYVIGTLAEEHAAARRSQAETPPDPDAGVAAISITTRPEHWWQWITFAFRELSRADFCFIVLALAAFDLTWILLPLGAVGAHAFWIAHLLPDARKYHV